MNIVYSGDYGFTIPFVMAFTLSDATAVKLSIQRPDGTEVSRTLDAGDYTGIGLNDTLDVETIAGDFSVAGYSYAQMHITKPDIEIKSDKVLFLVKRQNAFA